MDVSVWSTDFGCWSRSVLVVWVSSTDEGSGWVLLFLVVFLLYQKVFPHVTGQHLMNYSCWFGFCTLTRFSLRLQVGVASRNWPPSFLCIGLNMLDKHRSVWWSSSAAYGAFTHEPWAENSCQHQHDRAAWTLHHHSKSPSHRSVFCLPWIILQSICHMNQHSSVVLIMD